METEERLLGLIEDGEGMDLMERHTIWHERLSGKNKTVVQRFLGKGRRVHEVSIVPRYYGELLTWALQRYLEKEGWQTVRTLGYHGQEPVYIDVNTDYHRQENLLMDGQLLVMKGDDRLIVTVDINLRWRNSILVEGSVLKKERVVSFINGVTAMMKGENFYRGKKLEFAGRLRLLDLGGRDWDSIVLDADTKRDIKLNTIDFLGKARLWPELGIPPRRGVLIAGEPGTGKTVICKALMAEAEGITCITTSAYAMSSDDYVTELYELAQDLAPCLVFIEDIDLIGHNREESGYQNGPALLSLLAVLDGIEEKKEIVTVATTNCLETLDKALSQRPSRFDRVIKLGRPGAGQRRELVDYLCRRIPLEDSVRDYIVRHSEGYTPAQLQEVVFSLAIEHAGLLAGGQPLTDMKVGTEAVDRVMSRINGRARCGLGFRTDNNGHKPAAGLAVNEMKGKACEPSWG